MYVGGSNVGTCHIMVMLILIANDIAIVEHMSVLFLLSFSLSVLSLGRLLISTSYTFTTNILQLSCRTQIQEKIISNSFANNRPSHIFSTIVPILSRNIIYMMHIHTFSHGVNLSRLPSPPTR